jgi:Ca2+-binding RTX toxin-like protein
VYSDFGDIAISGATVAYTKSDGQDLEVYRTSAGVTTRLTTNTNRDGNLLIDGNTIVWQTYDATGTGDIYRNNGTTTTRITTNTVQEEDVQLSGSQLLWAASDGNDYEIYLNDGITTRALTNNTLDDYSPVLSGNRAAWFQWNNNQENLFFYDGSIAKQIATNLTISDLVIAGSNLVYKQTDDSRTTSLKFYNATTGTTSQLSANLNSFSQVAASGNLVAWLEPDTNTKTSRRSTLKLFNGTTTTTIATNVIDDSERFALRGSKIFYLGSQDNNYSGGLYLYDAASSTPVSTQLTIGELNYDYEIAALGVTGDRILWSNVYDLKLTQPSTKPVISFSSPSFSVVEGFTSPQNASLGVTLSAASSVPVTVRYETFTNYNDANEAYSGSDYTQTTGTLTFAAGVTSQNINVPIINDTYLESDETFYVRIFEPSNAVLVPGQNTATITISDTWQTTGANGSTFTLPAGVENLTLTGSTNINGVGNAGNNEIRGNSGNNRLSGGGGYDKLIGGLGDDTYVVSKTTSFEPTPTITENANEGTDTVEFASTATSDSYSLFDNNLENLIITGSGNHNGYGNDSNNVISGNSGNNYLSGNGGIDTVSYADAPGPAGVTVSLTNFGGSASGWGTDSLYGFENIIGSSFNDTLSGDSASNTLTGNAGKDTITGNGGSDKFDYRTLSHSALATFDRITDFDATTTGDRFLVGTARAGYLNGGQVSTLLTDAALTTAAISNKLTTTNFLANFAATITMGSGVTSRTFVVINNPIAGYSAVDDALVEVTGFSGTFNTSQFVTS